MQQRPTVGRLWAGCGLAVGWQQQAALRTPPPPIPFLKLNARATVAVRGCACAWACGAAPAATPAVTTATSSVAQDGHIAGPTHAWSKVDRGAWLAAGQLESRHHRE